MSTGLPFTPKAIDISVRATAPYTDPDTGEVVDPRTWLITAGTVSAQDVPYVYTVETSKDALVQIPELLNTILSDVCRGLFNYISESGGTL